MSTGSRTQNNAGFTLIEMMIVVGIVLIVASIVVWNFSGQVRQNSVRTAADMIRSAIERARTESLRQQVFPYLMTQPDSDYVSGVTDMPRYWPFVVQFYSWEEDGSTRIGVTVVAAKRTPSPPVTPADSDPNDHSADLIPLAVLPKGMLLTDPDGNTLDITQPNVRPYFFRDLSEDELAHGSVVGADAGIVVQDEFNPDLTVEIRIDPIYGSVSTVDNTRQVGGDGGSTPTPAVSTTP